jgi:hypothetical protein
MRFTTKALVAGGSVAIGLAALAAPAFADTIPVTANVGTAITMAWNSPASMDLSGLPGTSPTGSLSYTVSSNAATGYTVNVNPTNATGFADGTGDKIPNNKLALNGSAFWADSSAMTAHSKTGMSGGGGDPYTDAYQLNIPAGTPAGAYSQTLTYLATAK